MVTTQQYTYRCEIRKIRPTEKQIKQFFGYAGYTRFIWNQMVAFNKSEYKQKKQKVTKPELEQLIQNMRNNDSNYAWMKEYEAYTIKIIARRLENARKRSFEKYKNGYHINFKSRKFDQKTFPIRGDRMLVKDKSFNIGRIGRVKINKPVNLKPGESFCDSELVFKNDRWYVHFRIKTPYVPTKKTKRFGRIKGVDVGIKELAITYDGKDYQHYANINKSKRVKELERKLKVYNQQMARRRENQSKGYYKALGLYRKTHYKLKNIRRTHIQQVVNDIVKSKPKQVGIETLNLKGMRKQKKLNPVLHSISWGYFQRFLTQKVEAYGGTVVKYPQKYPSSKLCSSCNQPYNPAFNQGKQWGLDIREWTCECGVIHDRDENASNNLRKYALENNK